MFYKNELSFLCDILQKCRVDALAVDLGEYLNAEYNEELPQDSYLKEYVGDLSERTVYRFTDPYGLCYRVLVLPDTEFPTLFRVGPYLSSPISSDEIWQIGEKYGASAQKQRYLAEYYGSIPVITSDSPVWAAFISFCERIWGGDSFSVEDIAPVAEKKPVVPVRVFSDADGEDALLDIKTMERRYTFENQLIRSVEKGQLHMEERLKNAFSAELFEKRAADPLRNAQNYTIIMNTLLRKAAERGGVHPIHIDRVSSEIAKKIESMTSVSQTGDLMVGIFRTYCNLVRDHTMKDLPSIVRQAALMIEADLSSDLSPSLIAQRLGVSPGYLSAVFKRSTQCTVTEFVRQKRMEYAAYLLSHTALQVQTVALHIGIMDVQYFSKLFKRQHRMTPTEYRLSQKAK